MSSRPCERRKEQRFEQDAPVRLRYRDPLPVEIDGCLLDVSASGFRAGYRGPGPSPGCEVRFEFGARAGLARVVWNRQVEGRSETGFLVVRED